MKTYGATFLMMLLAGVLGAVVVVFFGFYGLVGLFVVMPVIGAASINRLRKRQQATSQLSSDWHLIYVLLAEDHFGNRRYGTLMTNNTNRMPDVSERVIIGPAIVGIDAAWHTTDEAALSSMIRRYGIDPYDAGTWNSVWPRPGERFPVYLP